jgi:hypothetical protein
MVLTGGVNIIESTDEGYVTMDCRVTSPDPRSQLYVKHLGERDRFNREKSCFVESLGTPSVRPRHEDLRCPAVDPFLLCAAS